MRLIATLAVSFASIASAHIHIPRDYSAWSKVARCESGGWKVLGSIYPDSLGITYTNYIMFGGKPQRPGRVSLRNRIAQIRIADRLIAYYHASIPDKYGCAAW